MKFVEEFIASNGKKDSVINAMNKFNNTPALARNLVGIYEFSKSDVESNVYNPWYEEMKKYNITSGDISVFKKYIEFENKMSIKEREKYKHCNPYLNQNHCISVDGINVRELR